MSLTQRATALGFPTLSDAGIGIDPAAARLLPADAAGLGVTAAAGVLEVIVDHIPTSAEISAFERASGCEVTITVAEPDQYAVLRGRATRTVPGRGIVELLTGIADSVTTLALHVGHPPLAATVASIQALSWPALSVDDLEDAEKFLLDGHPRATVTWAGRRWKVTAGRSNQQPSLNLVRATGGTAKLSQLGLPVDVSRIAGLPDGLVLISSARGSGRTQTLNALVDRAAVARAVTIVHAGDTPAPVVHRTGTVTRVAFGTDVTSPADAVQVALGARADILAVDAESYTHADVEALTRLALSGVLVLVAVPATDTRTALEILLGAVPDTHRATIASQLGAAYRCGLAQRLLPSTDSGQVVAASLWWQTPGLSAALASGDLDRVSSAALTGPGRGMNSSLDTAIRTLVAGGRISAETANLYTGALPGMLSDPADSTLDVPAGWDPAHPDKEELATAQHHARTGGRRKSTGPGGPVAPDLTALLDQRIDT